MDVQSISPKQNDLELLQPIDERNHATHEPVESGHSESGICCAPCVLKLRATVGEQFIGSANQRTVGLRRSFVTSVIAKVVKQMFAYAHLKLFSQLIECTVYLLSGLVCFHVPPPSRRSSDGGGSCGFIVPFPLPSASRTIRRYWPEMARVDHKLNKPALSHPGFLEL